MQRRLLIFLLSIAPLYMFAQNYSIQLRSGIFTPELKQVPFTGSEMANGKYYRLLQFYSIPGDAEKQEMEALGVSFLDYVPNNTYVVALPIGLNLSSMDKGNIRSIIPIEPKRKLDDLLSKKEYPEYALRGKGRVELTVMHYQDLYTEEIAEQLAVQGAEVIHQLREIHACRIIVKIADIEKIAALHYVAALETAEPEPTPDNLVGRTDHRSNMIATDYSGGLKYDGTGVAVALNDDGVIGPHIDYQGRIINQFITFNNGNHGDHCAGTIFGAGNRNPTTRGMAFGATLGVYGVSGSFSTGYQAFDSITSHYNKYGIRITSTSYSDGTNAGYTSRAQLMDIQMNSMSELIHVFSAGNAGSGFRTITGGHKQSKNTIAVGNLDYKDVIASSSSRGPARDGRLKPDIIAVGTNVNSTVNPNNYELKTGTSMSCPGVSGTLAQLYHAYKSLNSGANPPAALIKATVMNTADDLGNPGPDFKYGYGRINARRAFQVLQNNQYLTDSVSQGNSKNHTIAVPAGVAQIKIMVYWQDKEANVSAIPALVNNLDMKVVTPSLQNILPWVLDTATAKLNNNATQKIDSLNNAEQVTINNPAAGNYTVNVAGTLVPFGPQKYYVVYEFVMDQITVIYPSGGESVVPGTQETIRWDAYGTTGNFTIQYSTNNGTTWTNISTSVSGSQRYYDWTPPSVVTGQALIKVTRGTLTDQSDAPFSIIGVPSGLTVDWVCIDSMKISYSAVTGATGYTVTKLGTTYMDSVGFSTTTSCILKGINTTNIGWYSVQAIAPNNCIGRRAVAQQHSALPFNCVIPDDLGVVQSLTPTNNTIIDCQGSPLTEQVSIQLKNNSFSPISNIVLKYSVNGSVPVVENYAGPISGQATYNYTFTQPYIFMGAGTYQIKAWLEHPNDLINVNDTAIWTKDILIPSLVNLPLVENFETFTVCDTSADCGLGVCQLSSGWINDKNGIDDDIDWRINYGPTPSYMSDTTTGPSLDYNLGTPTGQYAYLEASNCFNKQANLISPCINLFGLQNPLMSFAYHMFGAGMGELHIDVQSNGQWINDIVPAFTGNKGSQWNKTTISLAAYIGQVINVRFRGITGATYQSDMAIDAISITESLGLNNTSSSINAQVFPNPSEGIFQIAINGASSKMEITVVDINGRIITRQQLAPSTGATKTVLQLQDQAAGVYFLSIKSDEAVINKKLVKY